MKNFGHWHFSQEVSEELTKYEQGDCCPYGGGVDHDDREQEKAAENNFLPDEEEAPQREHESAESSSDLDDSVTSYNSSEEDTDIQECLIMKDAVLNDKYEIVKQLGDGITSTVYLGKALGEEKFVAIKIPEDVFVNHKENLFLIGDEIIILEKL